MTTSDDDVDWKREAARNAAKYGRIRAQLDTAKEAIIKKQKEAEEWKRYSESLERKLAAFERDNKGAAGLGTPIPVSAKEDPAPSPRDNTAVISDEVEHHKHTRSAADEVQGAASTGLLEQTGPSEPQIPSSPPSRTGGDERQGTCPTQSDTSEDNRETSDMPLPELPPNDGMPAEPAIKHEPSSDIPVVVSERAVRKRKRIGPEDEQPSPTRVKQEDDESDPVLTADLCDFSPATSVDLDESGTMITTPRKKKKLEAIRMGALDSHGSDARGGLRQRFEAEKTPNTSRALQPLDPNVRTPRPKRPPKKDIVHAISELAEDGGTYGVSSDAQLLHPGPEPTPSRLSGLLSGSAVEAESPLIRQRPRPDRTPRAALDQNWPQAPQPRELPFDKPVRDRPKDLEDRAPRELPFDKTIRGRLKALEDKYPRANTASPACGTTKQGGGGGVPTARSIPPSELRLEDFKINPKFNKGYDYAYAEVVRKKDERSCIPGCVDMDCCGKQFRAMALAERGTGPRTPEQVAEDRRLLERYLGDKAYRLFSMTKEEKDEVWLEAKTRELADRIGKHRHRYGRMKSPPGFWRTDFPDTQEGEQEKEEEEKKKKKKETKEEKSGDETPADGVDKLDISEEKGKEMNGKDVSPPVSPALPNTVA